MLQKHQTMILILMTMVLASCVKHNFTGGFPNAPQVVPDVPVTPPMPPVPVDPLVPPDVLPQAFQAGHFFPYRPTQDFFLQDQYDRNLTSLVFQVRTATGENVPGIKAENLQITESGKPVSQFQLTSGNLNLGQKADIVFVIDVTNSMQPTIDKTKVKVKAFVENMKKNNIQASLCLVTFRDHTEKKCVGIVEDNPETSANENLDQFLKEVDQLKAQGGGDTRENQLRALMDASVAPWRANSQRMAILITDAAFHYQPNKTGDAGLDAPFYSEALERIQKSQMTVYTVAPGKDGYDAPLEGLPSIAEASKGQHFSYEQMLSGKISMESIFQSIVDRIATQYSVQYVVEENSNLDSSLPLTRRQLVVQVKGHSDYQVLISQVASNMPEGHPQYKFRWVLTHQPLAAGRLRIRVNGQSQVAGFALDRQELVFASAPEPGAAIEVTYDPADLKEGLELRPFLLPDNLDLTTLQVLLNGVSLSVENLDLSKDIFGNWVLDVNSVFSLVNDFRILEKAGLDVVISAKTEKGPPNPILEAP